MNFVGGTDALPSERCTTNDIDVLRDNYQLSLIMSKVFEGDHINCSTSAYIDESFAGFENPILVKLTDLKEEHVCET